MSAAFMQRVAQLRAQGVADAAAFADFMGTAAAPEPQRCECLLLLDRMLAEGADDRAAAAAARAETSAYYNQAEQGDGEGHGDDDGGDDYGDGPEGAEDEASAHEARAGEDGAGVDTHMDDGEEGEEAEQADAAAGGHRNSVGRRHRDAAGNLARGNANLHAAAARAAAATGAGTKPGHLTPRGQWMLLGFTAEETMRLRPMGDRVLRLLQKDASLAPGELGRWDPSMPRPPGWAPHWRPVCCE